MSRSRDPVRWILVGLACVATLLVFVGTARPAFAAPTKEGELDVVARYVFSKAAMRHGVNEVIVRIQNLSETRHAQGRVVIGATMPDSSGVESPYRIEPSGVVYLHLPTQVSESFTARVRVERDGQVVASEEIRLGIDRAVHIVDLAETTRLFGLSGMRVGASSGGLRSGPPTGGQEVDVDTPYTDASTGEIVLPTFATGWAGVSLAIITSERLARIEGAELESLSAFILGGGTLAVTVTRDEDLRVGTLPTLLGGPAARVLPRPEQLRPSNRFDISHPRITSANAPRAPGEMTTFTSWAGGNLTPSPLGATAQYGLGRVTLLGFDLGAPGVADDPWVQFRLVEAAEARGGMRSLATPGWPNENPYAGGRARYFLSPERRGNWGVALSAILLCIYAIVAGPIAFSRAKKQNRPLRALVWLPMFSLAMFAIVLGIGATARGSGTRARRLTFVDAGAGMDRGVGIRFRAVLFPDAATFDAAPDRRTSFLRRTVGRDADEPSMVQVDRDGVLVKDANVAPWETAILREEGIFPIGAGISVSMSPSGDVVVRNRTGKTLKSLLVKLPDETLRFFSELAPEGVVTAASAAAPGGMWRRFNDASGNEQSQVQAAMADGGAAEDGSLFVGVSGEVDHDVPWFPLHVPVVIATFDEPPGRSDVGAPIEWDRTLIRVVGVGGEP